MYIRINVSFTENHSKLPPLALKMSWSDLHAGDIESRYHKHDRYLHLSRNDRHTYRRYRASGYDRAHNSQHHSSYSRHKHSKSYDHLLDFRDRHYSARDYYYSSEIGGAKCAGTTVTKNNKISPDLWLFAGVKYRNPILGIVYIEMKDKLHINEHVIATKFKNENVYKEYYENINNKSEQLYRLRLKNALKAFSGKKYIHYEGGVITRGLKYGQIQGMFVTVYQFNNSFVKSHIENNQDLHLNQHKK